MSEIMLAGLGFLTTILIIVVLLKNWTIPSLAFICVSMFASVVLVGTGTFTIGEIGDFVKAGVAGTSATACLFVFSVLFFGIMTDAGMFDKIISKLIKKVGSNVVGVAVMSCVICMIGHLDGGGASTFLITIPAMLPIYKKLHMRPTTLLLICVTAMGVMNLLPWGGPTMRAASVLGIEANELWIELIPMQIFGVFVAFATAIIWGLIEKKRGAGLDGKLAKESTEVFDGDLSVELGNSELARPKLFLFNVVLTLCVIVSLIVLDVPSYLPFMVGCTIGLMANYRDVKLQNKIVKAHSGPALMMASTLFTAGVFLGIMSETGIMDHMANIIATALPASVGPYLPVIIGIISVPLAIGFSTDSYFYGLLPVLIVVGESFGVNPVQLGIVMVVTKNLATFISPVVPATFLGIGLAGIEIKDHIKACFFWIWGASILCLISGIIMGVITI
ncbi:MAG: citrate:proton symporter [Clostridia bacterium]